MVLPQSYRLPRLIQSFAQGWIRQLSRRETKNYQPRDAEGEIRVLRGGNYRYPGPVINDAERYLAEEKTVMFLASCSFMLEPILHALRSAGYHSGTRTGKSAATGTP